MIPLNVKFPTQSIRSIFYHAKYIGSESLQLKKYSSPIVKETKKTNQEGFLESL